MRSAVPSIIVLLLLAAAGDCDGQTWALVQGGAYALPSSALARIEATLEQTVSAAAASQAQKLAPWQDFSIQYQPQVLQGRRVVEIHGACHIRSGTDLHREFYLPLDGGPCFFTVVYSLESGRYSNVAFNGYG
jgi:hypothetical protein